MATKNTKNTKAAPKTSTKAPAKVVAPRKAPTKTKNAELVVATKTKATKTKAAPVEKSSPVAQISDFIAKRTAHAKATKAETVQVPAPAKRKADVVLPPVVDGFSNCPSCGTHLANGYHDGKVREYVCLGCGNEFGRKLPGKGKAPKAAPAPVVETATAAEPLRVSVVENPTAAVWDIADEMVAADPNVRRKDVIAECVNRGIAFYTARTQYQLWFRASKA